MIAASELKKTIQNLKRGESVTSFETSPETLRTWANRIYITHGYKYTIYKVHKRNKESREYKTTRIE